MTSLAFPAISVTDFGMDKWSVSHAAAKALIRFDTETRQTPGTFRRVEFINSSLVFAGIMNIVFRRLLTSSASTTDPVVPEGNQADQTLVDIEPLSTTAKDWFEIEQILRSCRRKGKTLYLVKCRDSPDTSWVKRKDLTVVAFERFRAAHPRRRRRRQ